MGLIIALLIIFSIILFIGMIGERDKELKKYLTLAFVVCILVLAIFGTSVIG